MKHFLKEEIDKVPKAVSALRCFHPTETASELFWSIRSPKSRFGFTMFPSCRVFDHLRTALHVPKAVSALRCFHHVGFLIICGLLSMSQKPFRLYDVSIKKFCHNMTNCTSRSQKPFRLYDVSITRTLCVLHTTNTSLKSRFGFTMFPSCMKWRSKRVWLLQGPKSRFGFTMFPSWVEFGDGSVEFQSQKPFRLYDVSITQLERQSSLTGLSLKSRFGFTMFPSEYRHSSHGQGPHRSQKPFRLYDVSIDRWCSPVEYWCSLKSRFGFTMFPSRQCRSPQGTDSRVSKAVSALRCFHLISGNLLKKKILSLKSRFGFTMFPS